MKKIMLIVLSLSFTIVSEAKILKKPKPTTSSYTKAFEILNNSKKAIYYEKIYQDTIDSIPDSVNVFSYLNSYSSKINFLCYIVWQDKTNENPLAQYYGNYAGYSLEFYKKFSDEIKDGKIKFKVPLHMAKVQDHFFLIFDLKIASKNSRNYWIYEAPTDHFVLSANNFKEWKFYTDNLISILDLEGQVKGTIDLGKLNDEHIE